MARGCACPLASSAAATLCCAEELPARLADAAAASLPLALNVADCAWASCNQILGACCDCVEAPNAREVRMTAAGRQLFARIRRENDTEFSMAGIPSLDAKRFNSGREESQKPGCPKNRIQISQT